MRKKLPTRTEVLEALESHDRPLHVRELADQLKVPQDNLEGLMRVVDSLIFDATVIAHEGQRFALVAAKMPAAAAQKPSPSRSLETRPNGARSPDPRKPEATRPAVRGERVEREEPARKLKGLPLRKAEPAQEMPGWKEERGERKSGREESRGGRERREGTLKVNPRGFGFVATPGSTGDDVFVPAESLGGAMNGDRVAVELVGRSARGAEGSIVEILARGTPRVSGILRRRGKSAWVEPDDPRIRGPVVLTREIDTADGSGNSGEDGQVVVVQITRFPDGTDQNPEGKLIGVLGAPGELSVEVRKVLLLAAIEEVHSDEAIAEAEAYGLEVPAEMLEGREDLTHIPLPTIDPDDARDHDDAVWVARAPKGGYELWVAIADVSSYVRPGTKLDEESQARGCSIYLPDRAIPMLPRALSSNLCSLLPDVIRLCLCVHATLDASGNVTSSRLVRGFMKSAAKLTYSGVARALGLSDLPARQPKADELVDGLKVALELSTMLRGKRMKRGALDFDLPEAVVKLDAEGKPKSVQKRAQDLGIKKAYQLIEELMIFANETVARWLVSKELNGVFRVHLPPDPKKLDRLAAMTEMLGLELDIETTQTPKGLADVLKSFADHPLAGVLNNLLLRSMKQAVYDVQNLGHFGLASDAYLHFTSPIRRYPDLVVHRIVHAKELGDKKVLVRVNDLETLTLAASASSSAERRAMEVEREIIDIYRCFYMLDHIGEQFEGTVSAFVGSGAFVTLDDPFVDVMVKTEDMGGDFVVQDDGLMATSRRSGDAIRLGDRLLLQITDAAILRRTVYAKIVRSEESIAREGPRYGGGKVKPGARGNEVPQRGGFGGSDGRNPRARGTAITPGKPGRGGGKPSKAGPGGGKSSKVKGGKAPSKGDAGGGAPNTGRKSGKGFGKKGKGKKR